MLSDRERAVKRLRAPAAVGVAAFVLLAGAAAGGYAIHRPATATRTVTVTVTKWRTVSGSGLHAPCSATSAGASSPLFLVVGNLQAAGLNGLYEGMCAVTVSPFNSAGNGVITLTDPSGLRTTYNLGLPAGH
jgi:hypothetical protein